MRRPRRSFRSSPGNSVNLPGRRSVPCRPAAARDADSFRLSRIRLARRDARIPRKDNKGTASERSALPEEYMRILIPAAAVAAALAFAPAFAGDTAEDICYRHFEADDKGVRAG